MLKDLLIDRKARIQRLWSNQELRRFAPHFTGDIVNVSAWTDVDKEGRKYADYFSAKNSYTITNYKADARGMQGYENEIFLDLTAPLPTDLKGKFDVVFNHTTLEHIFEVHKAVENLCLMSKGFVIIVVPFLQPMHASYGDYWRFTPTCMQKLLTEHGMRVKYSSFNNDVNASTYLFTVAVRDGVEWLSVLPTNIDSDGNVPIYSKPFLNDEQLHMVGLNAIINYGPWIKAKLRGLKKYLENDRKSA